ncbi:MAG: metalloregulator ArsR/SmtB family transcription factor [Pseudomonadota bacterium]
MNKLIQKFSALSDATRLDVVERLMAEGELPAGAIVADADMSAPAMSRHLKVLRKAGLIHQRIEGTKRLYSVRPEAMRAIADWTLDHKTFWDASLDRLEAHLALSEDGDDI